MFAAVSVAQTTVSIASSLRSQSYSHLADEAVQAGIAYATSCLNKTPTSYWTNPLTPQTSCAGSSSSGNNYIEQNSQYTSTFAVATPDTSGTNPKAYVTGTVTLANSTKQYVAKGVAIVNVASSQATTTLPVSPIDGQEVYYQVNRGDGTNALWHLRYNASTTYWDFLGGPPFFNYDSAGSRTTSSNSYNCPSGTPSFTAPLAGDYQITWGNAATTNGTNSTNVTRMAIYVGGSQMGYDNVNVLPAGGGQGSATSLTGRFANITSGLAVRVCYRSESSLTATWFSNYEQITPIRVK